MHCSVSYSGQREINLESISVDGRMNFEPSLLWTVTYPAGKVLTKIDPGLFIVFLCLSFNWVSSSRQVQQSLRCILSRPYISGNCILVVENWFSTYCILSENTVSRLAETPGRADRRNSLALFCWLNSSKDKTGSAFKVKKGLWIVKIPQKQTHKILETKDIHE